MQEIVSGRSEIKGLEGARNVGLDRLRVRIYASVHVDESRRRRLRNGRGTWADEIPPPPRLLLVLPPLPPPLVLLLLVLPPLSLPPLLIWLRRCRLKKSCWEMEILEVVRSSKRRDHDHECHDAERLAAL